MLPKLLKLGLEKAKESSQKARGDKGK